MRLIHRVPFSSQEVESFRQQIFNNLTHGLKYVLESMEDMQLEVSPENSEHIELVESASDLRDGEIFPTHFYEPLKALWNDKGIQQAWDRGNEAALPEKYTLFHFVPPQILSGCLFSLSYFFSDLDRLFGSDYVPTEQDIVRCRARTIGITETVFHLRDHEMLMVDVGGQKSERRKWIHCFQDVTSILFLVSLSGYDQCLVEDKDAVREPKSGLGDSYCRLSEPNARCHDDLGFNMLFSMVQVDVNCVYLHCIGRLVIANTRHKILFLNKDDLFQAKIQHSNIKTFFPVRDFNLQF